MSHNEYMEANHINAMKYRYKVCILLTACVNPCGMSHTALQDPDVRAEQYRQALDFYIKETNLPIVFCENTMYDMSVDYKQYINSGRLEFLSFDGNNYDKQRGKGYGEAVIMRYAVEHSNLVRDSKYIIKITGRLIVADIKKISSSPLLYLNNLFRSNIKERFISTYLFVASPVLLQKFVNKYQELIWEDSPTNDLIEHHWFRALTQDPGLNDAVFIPFVSIPQVAGISGTTGERYSMDDRLIGNMVYSYGFEKARNNSFLAILYLAAYYVLLFRDRLEVKLGMRKKSFF